MNSDTRLHKPLTWPMLSDDGVTLFFCHGGDAAPEVWWATRVDRNVPFAEYHPAMIDGKVLIGRAPRYVSATDELYITVKSQQTGWDLYVVRDFQETVIKNAR